MNKYPNPYGRRNWPNFIENYERQVNEFVSQGCDFYFNLLFWRAMRCIPLAVFLRDTMPEFCRGYMGYLFRYFLDGEKVDGKDTITYKNSNGEKISIYTSEFDGSIKERELAKKIVSKAGGAHNGQDTFRYRGQISKNDENYPHNFGCTALYNIGGTSRPRAGGVGGYTQAFKGYQYYMQACIEILNNGTCRQGPHSALRKLGINTQGQNLWWGAWQTLLLKMWMLYSPNNSGVYSIHFWPETVHMFIRGIQIMFAGGEVPWNLIKDDWNLTGGYHDSENHAASRWLIGRSINCFLNDDDRQKFIAAQAYYMNNFALLRACLRSTAIRDEGLAKIPTTWINFEYPDKFDQWWDRFGHAGRNTVIEEAVQRVRLATRTTVDAFLRHMDYTELQQHQFHQPSNQQNNQLIDLDDFTNDASRTLNKVKIITDKSGRKMSGHISEHRQTAINDDDLYIHHLGDVDIGEGFKMSNMANDDIGKLKHMLETIRALVAGDDGAPPIPDSSKVESRTTLKYSPRSAREGTAVEAAHTTVTVKRVVHLCLLDHLTAEGPIEPLDDGTATNNIDQKTGNPWEWDDFRNFMFAREAYNGCQKQHKLQQYIVHNAIQEWNNSPFMFAALGDAHYFVDDADAPLEMAIQLGGQRYIFNHGIRKLEQVDCLPPLDKPDDDTFVQFWANMVFFALFGGLNPYKEYWLPSPVNESVRIYSLHHILWQNDVDDNPDPDDRTYSDWVDDLNIRVNGTLKNTVLNNLGSYIAAYMDFMMNIQNDQGGRDIKDATIFQITAAGPQGQLTEDLVNDYFPKRQLVFDRVVDMIVPYMVNDNGQMIRKSSSENMFKPDYREWFHTNRPDLGIYGVLGGQLDPNTNPKLGGWFKQYWMRTFNGELATAKQFRTPGNGGHLAQKGDKIFDEIANVTPLRDNIRFKSTGKEYATLNTIMWPHYTNKTGGGIKDAADSLKFYKIQLRNVFNTDGVTPVDLMDNIKRDIEHEQGQQLLPNLYEMGLFYQEWHVQTYMFRQVYLDGRDSTIGKNCWDGFRAQDKELARVVRRPCFLKFNNHARQYDRTLNREVVNVGLEPFLLDDEEKRTPFFHRGLESNMIGHCINSKQSATSIQRRMTIGFAEQIQRITDAFTNTLLPNTLPVEWGDHTDNHLTITSIRTSILERSIGDNTFALHSEWWKTNLKQPAKMNCQPGVVMVRYPWPIEVGRLSRNKGTGLIFCGGQYRHAEMMIGGRCREPDQDDDIDNATWNMLPRLVSLNESAQQARPTVPYYRNGVGGKPNPLVRTIINYTNGTTPPPQPMMAMPPPPQGNTVIDDFIELKF